MERLRKEYLDHEQAKAKGDAATGGAAASDSSGAAASQAAEGGFTWDKVVGDAKEEEEDDDEWDPADDDDWRTALAHLSRTQKFLIAWGSLAGVGFGVGCFYLLIAARCCDSFVYRARGYRRAGGRVGFDGEFEAFDEDGDEYPGALEDDDGLEMMAKRA